MFDLPYGVSPFLYGYHSDPQYICDRYKDIIEALEDKMKGQEYASTRMVGGTWELRIARRQPDPTVVANYKAQIDQIRAYVAADDKGRAAIIDAMVKAVKAAKAPAGKK